MTTAKLAHEPCSGMTAVNPGICRDSSGFCSPASAYQLYGAKRWFTPGVF